MKFAYTVTINNDRVIDSGYLSGQMQADIRHQANKLLIKHANEQNVPPKQISIKLTQEVWGQYPMIVAYSIT